MVLTLETFVEFTRSLPAIAVTQLIGALVILVYGIVAQRRVRRLVAGDRREGIRRRRHLRDDVVGRRARGHAVGVATRLTIACIRLPFLLVPALSVSALVPVEHDLKLRRDRRLVLVLHRHQRRR